MSEMINRLAAKLREANQTWARAAPMMDGFHMDSVYHFMAAALLEEMREATEPMRQAAINAVVKEQEACRAAGTRGWSYSSVDITWDAMIDAALNEKGPASG